MEKVKEVIHKATHPKEASATDHAAGTTGAHGTHGTTGTHGTHGTHSGSTNAGPHDSNMANAADPRGESHCSIGSGE